MSDLAHTLRWIVELLRNLDMPFQAAGGLAAKAYGAQRPLVDLDFYVPSPRLADIARAAAAYLVRPPSRHRDESWDIEFMKIEYGGHEVEFGGADGARFFDRLSGSWSDADIDFGASVRRDVAGVSIPVMPVSRLVAYKRALDREVDRQDLAEIGSAALEEDETDT
jgi:hypothetical protein